MKTVYCPVKAAQVNGTDCMVICDVADRLLNPSALPGGIAWSEEQREWCLKCPYHADLESSEE